jgi:UDP-N-acetylmuramyl pentapeptide phosphotransferase/UDP-N-acetylglucosamine-1-phosphate transferase
VTSGLHIAGWVAWFLVPAAVASVATKWLIDWVSARGFLDIPNSRSSHTRATPRGGGIAIVAVTAWAAIVAAMLWPESWRELAGVIAPALAIAAVSWIDDIRPLQNRIRFGVHLASAAAAISMLGPVQAVDLGSLGIFRLGATAWLLTLLWIVGMTNAFNFMDGIDGIAGITAAIAGVALAAAAGCLGLSPLSALSLAFAGGAIGFLTRNWPPARIFMGDVGSAFCGFVITVLPLVPGSPASSRLVPLTAVAMWPFIFDTAFTLCRRLFHGENIFEAHRSHLYQRLVIAGWPHRAVSTLYGFLSALAAAIAVAPFCDEAFDSTVTSLAAAAITVGAVLLVLLVQFAERPIAQEARSRKRWGPNS